MFLVPGQPLNFKAEPESETSILLSWTPPRSDTIASYELVYKDGEHGEEVRLCFSPCHHLWHRDTMLILCTYPSSIKRSDIYWGPWWKRFIYKKRKLTKKKKKGVFGDLMGVGQKRQKNQLLSLMNFLIWVSKILTEVSGCKRIYSLRFGDFLSLSSALK